MEVLTLKPNERAPKNFTGKVIWKSEDLKFTYAVIYFKNGLRHRADGPAYVNFVSDGIDYMLDGVGYDKEKWFEQLTSKQKVKALFNPENF